MGRNRSVQWPFAALALLLTLAGPSAAQDESPPAATPVDTAPAEPAAQEPSQAPAVSTATVPASPSQATAGWPTVASARSNNPKHPNRASLGDSIVLQIPGLKAYLGTDEEKCDQLVLFLDEVTIDGSSPESCDPYQEEVRYHLDRTDKSDTAWHTLLAEPVGFSKKIDVSVGPEGRLMFPTKVKDFDLEVLPAVEFYGFFAMLVIGVLGFIRLARRTPLLRDPSGAPGTQGPYSLARFQLAFWSILVIAAYIFIWMITEELDTITGSVLVLLGIGSGTALGAALIDQGKQPAPASTEAAQPVMASQGFLHDVLSDDRGISLYRFQLFIWTLVLGVIFCVSVYDGLAMPQFSTTLLGLMGISSGTYLGFKVPEQTKKE